METIVIDDSDCSDLSNDGVADTTDEAHGLIQAEGAPDEGGQRLGPTGLQAPTAHVHAEHMQPPMLQPAVHTTDPRQQYLAQLQAVQQAQQYRQLAPAGFVAQSLPIQQPLQAAQHQMNGLGTAPNQVAPQNGAASSAQWMTPQPAQAMPDSQQQQFYADLARQLHAAQQQQMQQQALQHTMYNLQPALAPAPPMYAYSAQPQAYGLQSVDSVQLQALITAQQIQQQMAQQQSPAWPAAVMAQPAPAAATSALQHQPAQVYPAGLQQGAEPAQAQAQPSQQPNFFAAVWDSMRAAASALGQQTVPAAPGAVRAQSSMQPPAASSRGARAVKAEPSSAGSSVLWQQAGMYPAQRVTSAVKAEAPSGVCAGSSKAGPSQQGGDAMDDFGIVGAAEGADSVADEAALEGVLEGLKMADAPEADVPPGKMTVTLHAYQKRALGWMRKRENPGSVNAVCGGILADEQGLGKTVQAIALIVMEVPSRTDAEAALADAQREQNMMALHPESAEARAARAAGIGIFPAGARSGSASASGDASPGVGNKADKGKAKAQDEACESPPRKKAKKGPIQYEPCGRGEFCTCAICKKAKDQQRKAAEREIQRAWRAEMSVRKEAKDRASQGPPKGQPIGTKTPAASEQKLLLPDIMSPDGSVAKRTLVVCPLCVAAQWVDEVREKAPQLRVKLYHGPNRSRDFTPALLACYDVIVTTYWVLASEFGASPQGPLYCVRWHRCILDEAHLIRNSHTNAAKAAAQIDATRRWCLTGTPIINAATDVHMLFVFLQYAPFNNIELFNRLIRNKIETVKLRNGRRITPNQAARDQGYKELRTAMRAVTLRRMKSDEYKGQPLVVLPAKVIALQQMQFSEEEEAIYRAFEEKSQLDFKEYVRKGFGANYSHILVLLMRLRQVCIHPWLAQTEDASAAAVASGGDEEQDPNAHPSGLSVERAAELLEKLTGGDAGECPICMDGAQDAVLTACAHGPFCRECIISSLQHQGGDQAEGTCPLCRAELAPAKLYSAAQLQPPAPIDIEEEAAALDAAKQPDDDWALEEERFVSSSKLDAVVRLLEQYREEDEAAGPGTLPTKTIVFSTFTRALDLLERRLRPGAIGFLRLDGRMRLSQRTDAIRAFARDPQARVLLASTKAAGMGLNVTCACRAIILDVWWNGAFEDQAVDRCHRLGQTREVHVSKLIMTRRDPSKETVEQRIMVMQDHKREIAEAALGSEGTSGGARLSLNDLRVLFGIRRAG